MRALSALLGYAAPGGGRAAAAAAAVAGGLGVATARLVDALDRASKFQMDAETRVAYFDCVAHLVGRAPASLSPGDVERLVSPLVDAWKSQTWKYHSDTGAAAHSQSTVSRKIVIFDAAV